MLKGGAYEGVLQRKCSRGVAQEEFLKREPQGRYVQENLPRGFSREGPQGKMLKRGCKNLTK